MDPIAHTLVGASLAEAGLKKQSRLATATLLIGANLPDIDAIAMLFGQDAMYGFRRGWTHGAVAMIALPALLAGLMILFGRWRPAREGPEVKPWVLLGVACIGVWSHPALDWLNNYGVRLLMPFDDTWFYGDSIFILDPWMWLSMGAAVVLARSRSKMSLGAWSVLGLAMTGLITVTETVPWPAKLVWVVAVAAIVFARTRPQIADHTHTIARVSLVSLALYLGAMIAGTAQARHQATAWYESRGVPIEGVMAGPLPANPFARDVIAITPEAYHFARLSWFSEPRFSESHPPVPINNTEVAQAARDAVQMRGFSHWLRLPSYTIEPLGDGHRVRIQDVRYNRAKARIGRATVDLDSDLKATRVIFKHEGAGH